MDKSLLKALVEEQLGSVVFVMDYVQLDFSVARFRAYVWPTVNIGDAILHFGELVIRFGLGQIVTNPEPTHLVGAEIAQLQVHEGPFKDASLTVWRPGEDVFAGRDWS